MCTSSLEYVFKLRNWKIESSTRKYKDMNSENINPEDLEPRNF